MNAQYIRRPYVYAENRMILATDRFMAAKTPIEKEKARKWAYAWLSLSRKLNQA